MPALKLKETPLRIREHERKISALRLLRLEELRTTKLPCLACKKESMLSLWVLRRPAWRLPPSKEHIESRKAKESSEIRFVCPCCHTMYRLCEQDEEEQAIILEAQDIMMKGEYFSM